MASDTDALQPNATLFQILAAIIDLARRDFYWLDECDVVGADVTIYCSVLALVKTGHGAAHYLGDSRGYAQMRARRRIHGPGASAVACTSMRYNPVHGDAGFVCCSSAGLRSVCGKRRISPNVR